MTNQTLDAPPRPLADQRPVRLYQEDDEKLRTLHRKLGKKYDVEIVKLIRDSVHRGLPLILDQYKEEHSR
jgi:hypothetical protein